MPDPDEGFRVTDRRRGAGDPPGAAPSGEPRDTAEPGARPSAAPSDQRSLHGLFMMLATEAVVALGDAPDPASGQRQRDLPRAAAAIDLLLLLRGKTEGNRTSEETQILDELLYDLQLRYVRVTKAGG